MHIVCNQGSTNTVLAQQTNYRCKASQVPSITHVRLETLFSVVSSVFAHEPVDRRIGLALNVIKFSFLSYIQIELKLECFSGVHGVQINVN
jgi:hypothetical protein